MKKIITHLSKDAQLRPIILSGEVTKLIQSDDLYNDLVKSVIFQQLSTKAASTIYGRFIDLFEMKKLDPEVLLKLEIPTLRDVGLSNSKANYVRNISLFFIAKDLFQFDWTKYDDEEVIDLLTQIKGVGVWTVQMILISSLAREDVFPIGDLGIQKSMSLIYGLNMKDKDLTKKMIKISKKWKPYRSYVSIYLWKFLDS